MKDKMRILIGIMLWSLMILRMMPGTEVKADTQPDDLTICDTLFVQYGQSINGVTGTATLTYENDGPVGQGPMLTLNNYTNRVEDFDGIYYDGDEILTIVLVGNNEITSTMNDGIMSYVPVMITGDGQLTVSANYSGFEGCGDNTLCVNRGQVTIKGNEYGVRANVSVSELAQLTAICGSEFEGIKGDVEVSGYAQVEATGGVGIRGKVRVASDNGKVIANGKYGIIGDVEARHGQVIATGENGIEGSVKILYGLVKALCGDVNNSIGINAESGVVEIEESGQLIASGTDRAIKGIIKSSTSGTGWDDVNGIGIAYTFKGNEEKEYYYKRLQFPVVESSSSHSVGEAKKKKTVTFKVVNGSWDDGTDADKTVALTGKEGDTLKMRDTDIPAVGSKPKEGYTAGAWDKAPTADTAITADTTYTYTYAPKGDKENKGETENKGDTENKKETENNGETENTDKKVKAKFKITPKAVRKGKKTTVKITSTSGGKITIKGKSKNAKNKKYVKISGSKVVFQKKAPKGTYKFTVTSAAKGNYLKTTKTISIKVK